MNCKFLEIWVLFYADVTVMYAFGIYKLFLVLGLQKDLYIFGIYCKKWMLSVNSTKL